MKPTMNPAKTTAKSSSSTTQKRKYKVLKGRVEDIKTNVELIRQGQRAGTKGISRKQKRKVELKKKQFQETKTALQLMKAQVAEQREETTRVEGETVRIIQATEDIQAEIEFLRMHTDEMIDILKAEENLIMEIINSA